jgi:hypothetical protein
MHIVGIGVAVFAALWLWSWTERRRIIKAERREMARLYPAPDREARRFLPWWWGVSALAAVVVFAMIASQPVAPGRHTDSSLSDSDIAFLCRTGATVPGHCKGPTR